MGMHTAGCYSHDIPDHDIQPHIVTSPNAWGTPQHCATANKARLLKLLSCGTAGLQRMQKKQVHTSSMTTEAVSYNDRPLEPALRRPLKTLHTQVYNLQAAGGLVVWRTALHDRRPRKAAPLITTPPEGAHTRHPNLTR